MSGEFESDLDWIGDARMDVRWRTERSRVVDYAVTLTAMDRGRRRTIRVYDGAHASTNCIATRGAAGSKQAWSSMPVRFRKASLPRSLR